MYYKLNSKVNNLKNKTFGASTLIQINLYNTDKKKLENKWRCWYKFPDINGWVITIVVNTKISEVENKIPDSSGLMTAIFLNTKIGEVENKVSDHDKYSRI